MRKIITAILIGVNLFTSFGQENNEVKYQLAKEVFNSDIYVKSNYDKFSGKIDTINSTIYQIGDKIIKVENGNPKLRDLIEKRIFNPDVIFGKETTIKSKEELDKLSKKEKVLFNITRNDSLIICCFEQLEMLNPNPQTKRFKFWVFRIGIANPTEYYIEIYNNKATKETEWNDFIKNSIMSFYYKGSLII